MPGPWPKNQHIFILLLPELGEMGTIEMPVTKLDDKGRILLPGDIRKTGGLKEGDEFAVDSLGDGIFILKKIDLRSMLKEAIERAKSIDHEKVEREIEEESNQLARKRFEVCPR